MSKRTRKKRLKKANKKLFIFGTCFAILTCSLTVRIYSSTLERLDSSDPKYNTNTSLDTSTYYYEEKNSDRYLAYQALHPNLDIDEIIWQVNADLDKPYYQDANEITDTENEIILVNKHNKLPDDFEPNELVELSYGTLVTPATKEAYEKVVKDASSEGYSLRGASAYRSINYQVDVYNRYLRRDPQEIVDTYSARPGFSEHHTGRTIDLDTGYSSMSEFENTKEAKWVAENAYKYGFIVRYPEGKEEITGYIYEPWHITYVGTDISTKMKEFGIDTLEEYWVKYVEHQED